MRRVESALPLGALFSQEHAEHDEQVSAVESKLIIMKSLLMNTVCRQSGSGLAGIMKNAVLEDHG